METKPIRVLQVIGIMNRGGAEAMIMNLYRKIDRTKVQFDFLVHFNQPALYDDEIKELGGKIYYAPRFKGYNIKQYYDFCDDFFKNHPEYKVVHGHIGSCAALYLKAAKKHGCFTIAHSHNTWVGFHFKDLPYRIFSYPTRHIADYFFGCSLAAGQSRFGNKVVKSNSYKNFHNAIDLENFKINLESRKRIRDEFGVTDDNILIGTVGRITEQKNPEMIFQIFKYLVENNNNIKCLWIGTGNLESLYKGKVIERGLEKQIILTGVC